MVQKVIFVVSHKMSCACMEEGRTEYAMSRIPAIRSKKERNLGAESFSAHTFNGQDLVFMCHRIYFFISSIATQQILNNYQVLF